MRPKKVWPIVAATILAFVMTLGGRANDGTQHAYSGVISDIRVINLKYGENNVELAGMLNFSSSIPEASPTSLLSERGIILRINLGYGIRSPDMYLVLAPGLTNWDLVTNSGKPGDYFKEQGAEPILTTAVKFFIGSWQNHRQTFAIVVNANFSPDESQPPPVIHQELFYFSPGIKQPMGKLTRGPDFELLRNKILSEKCYTFEFGNETQFPNTLGSPGQC